MLDSVHAPRRGVYLTGSTGHIPKGGRVYSVTIVVTAIYITVLLCHVFVLVSVEVLTQGTWNDLGELEDPELVGLAQRLQGTIACSRADSTVKKYLGAFRR